MRIIDLDKLKQNLCGDCTMNFPKECRQIGCVKVDKQDFLEALRLPIIDAVPVIRCKDCKCYTGKWCTKFSTKQFDINDICKAYDDYCSMAERKEE